MPAGYAYVPFASLESVVEANKDLYYKAWGRTQTTLKNGEPDWAPWIGFFLRSLKKQKDTLKARIEKEQADAINGSDLPQLSLDIIACLRENGRQTAAEIAKATNANRNTLKVRLRELVDLGRIRRFGRARGTWYTL